MKKKIAYVLLILVVFTVLTDALIAQKPQALSVTRASADMFNPAGEASRNVFEVGAGSVRFHTYRMNAGEQIRIELSGDGDTDLDMYVYSSDGALIDARESDFDDETSYIRANRSGTIIVKVVNHGSVYNRYSLTVWED